MTEPTGTVAPAKNPSLAGKPGPIHVVEFVLGNENFAIDLFDVREVVEYTTITKLPHVPAYVRGIIDLRGEITMIIDLRQRLDIEGGSSTPVESSRIIVLDNSVSSSKTGIMVDDVNSVSTFDGDQVDYTSASLNREESSIIGIIKQKVGNKKTSNLIIWIDIRKLLAGIDRVG